MVQSKADRNLLIGILAVQMDFIARDQLIEAMNSWLLDKSQSLDAVLFQQSAIDAESQRLLVALVDKHIARHAGDTVKSLASLSQSVGIPAELDRIEDGEVSKTLSLLPLSPRPIDPFVTAPPPIAKTSKQPMRYQVLRAHNSGGLGTVSVAKDEELGREVALKEIKEKYADHPGSRRRFLIEAEITGCLEHPGIVPVYGLGHYDDGRPYYAMRFIRGESLQDAIDRFHADEHLKHDWRQRMLELRQLLRRFLDVCNAMEYAHSRGVLHRDLKPENVMLGKYGETLVVDWGLAKADDQIELTNNDEPPLRLLSGSETSSTQMGARMGTPTFMSPEQAEGRIDLLNATSDVYSLGATLYTLLTGKHAFTQDTIERVMLAVIAGNFPRPRVHDPHLPRGLEAICLKAMSLKPDDRYPTAATLAADVERWLADEPVSANTEPLTKRLARWSRQHRTLVSSLLVGTLASILILSVSLVFLVAANQRERTARNQAESERARAESNLEVAKQAVATMLTEVGREELSQYPQMEQTRQKLLAKARSFYDDFLTQRPKDDTLRFERAVALRNLAEVDRLADNFHDAETRYRQSIDELQSLKQAQPSNIGYRRQLATVLNDLGILLKTRKSSDAIVVFDQAIAVQKELRKEDPSPTTDQETARSFYNRGMVYAEQSDRKRGESDDLAAIEILERLQAAAPNDSIAHELSRCYNNYANLLQASGDQDAARMQFSKAIRILEGQTKKHSEDRDLLKELAIYQNNYANLLSAAGDYVNADEASSLAIEKLAALAEPLPLIASELANAHHSRGVILSQRKQVDEAQSEYDRARAILTRLSQAYPEVALYHDRLGNAFFQLGSMHFQNGRADEAVPLIQSAIQEHQAALKSNPNESGFQGHLRNDFVGYALVQLKRGDHAQAFQASLDMSKDFSHDKFALFDAAQLFARCSAVLDNPPVKDSPAVLEGVREKYITSALATLEAAITAGFNDIEKFDKALQNKGAFHHLQGNKMLEQLSQKIGLQK